MNTSRNLLVAAVAAISLGAVATSASAQASATGTGSASVQVLKALSAKSAADLKFGKVAISDDTAGTVTINEDGTRARSGGVALVGTAPASTPNFKFNGEPGQTVTVSYSDAAGAANSAGTYTLASGDTNLTLTITSTKVGSQTLDGSGDLTVPVKGVVDVPAKTAGGTYNGSFYVTVAYN